MQGTSGGDIFTLQDAPTPFIIKKQGMTKEPTKNAFAHLAPTAFGLLTFKITTHFDNQLLPGEDMRPKPPPKKTPKPPTLRKSL